MMTTEDEDEQWEKWDIALRTSKVSGRFRLAPNHVLLDNQATVGIFKERGLLFDLTKSTTRAHITGVGGESLVTDTVGTVTDFGQVYYNPRATANILSFAAVEKLYKIEYHSGSDFSVYVSPGRTYVFKLIGDGLYACAFPPAPQRMESVNTTVA